MLKKVLTGAGIASVLTLGVIIGATTIGSAFAAQPQHTNPVAQAAVQNVNSNEPSEAAVEGPDTDLVEEQVGDQNELDDQNQDLSEADEAAALQANATITAVEAEAAALAANPGATVIKTELDNENGALVYSVELSNGNDVKVDAGTATILHTDAGGQDSEDGEQATAED